jgi:hypothetical protein
LAGWLKGGVHRGLARRFGGQYTKWTREHAWAFKNQLNQRNRFRIRLQAVLWESIKKPVVKPPSGLCSQQSESPDTSPARRGEMVSNRREDHEISMLALHLIQNCMVYINTLMIQKVLAQPMIVGPQTSLPLASYD